MAYTKTTLISRPASPNDMLSGVLDSIKSAGGGVVGSVIDFYGAGLKAQGAQEALAAQLKEQQASQKAASSGEKIPTTYLLVGGAALVGLLVFAMRRK